jgi:hypothetical protein
MIFAKLFQHKKNPIDTASWKPTPAFLGFLQATALVLYISLVAYFFSLGPIFSNKGISAFFGPVAILLLFTLSATISGLLVLGKAGMLFWEKKI